MVTKDGIEKEERVGEVTAMVGIIFSLMPPTMTASDPFTIKMEKNKLNIRHSLPLADDAEVIQVPGLQVGRQRRHDVRETMDSTESETNAKAKAKEREFEKGWAASSAFLFYFLRALQSERGERVF